MVAVSLRGDGPIFFHLPGTKDMQDAIYTEHEVAEAMEILRGRQGSTALLKEVLDDMERVLLQPIMRDPLTAVTTKIDYTDVDAAIVAAVMTGCHRMQNFENDTNVRKAVDALKLDRKLYRTIDARLQSLKRSGRLEFHKKYGWRLKEKQS